MNLKFGTEKEFIEFKDELKKRLRNREIVEMDKPGFIPSAVMILLMNKDNEAHVFLTKRTESVGTHKGEVSFPGGAIEPEDRDAQAAALRETYEEAGIVPGDIEVLGRFDDFFSIAGFHVSTFIGIIDYPCNYKINKAEIDAFLEAPLSIFYNREFDRTEIYEFQGRDIEVYYYSYTGFIIWGLTARILTELGQRVLKD